MRWVIRLLGKMDTYSNETKHAFEGTLDWLNQWACARSFGLGSRMPWDKEFLVESLSDSTIYMSYYTVAHLIQGAFFPRLLPDYDSDAYMQATGVGAHLDH